MAARKRGAPRPGPWRFYTYHLVNETGNSMYVGKGSGRRLDAQKRRYGLAGNILAMFFDERDAYAAERTFIAELKPALNKHPGGNGSSAIKKREPRFAAIDRVGSRRYAARLLLRFQLALTDKSKIDEIRRIAYGPRC